MGERHNKLELLVDQLNYTIYGNMTNTVHYPFNNVKGDPVQAWSLSSAAIFKR